MVLKLWQVIKPGDGLIKQGAAWKALDKSTGVFHIYCLGVPALFTCDFQGIVAGYFINKGKCLRSVDRVT